MTFPEVEKSAARYVLASLPWKDGIWFEQGHAPRGVRRLDKFASNVTALKAWCFFFPMGFPLGFPMRVRVNSDGLCAWFDSNSFFPMFFFPIVFFQWFSSGLCFPEVQGRLEHGEPVDVYRTGYSRRVFWYPDFEACLNEMLGPWCCEVWTRKLRMSTSTSCGIGMETF